MWLKSFMRDLCNHVSATPLQFQNMEVKKSKVNFIFIYKFIYKYKSILGVGIALGRTVAV